MGVTMENVQELVEKAVKAATESLRTELREVREENAKLKERMTNLERNIEKNEQYSRKTSLILSGKSIPTPSPDQTESPHETRAIAAKAIKEKLNVNMQGSIVACHRLKNKKRILVKFQDLSDRDAVYQARFEQEDSADRIIIHENLTEPRANMIRTLSDMKEKNIVVNYHTKNGTIFARDTRDKKYAVIEPWFSQNQVVSAMESAPLKQTRGSRQATNGETNRLLRSQTLANIPPGHVAGRAADLSEFVVDKRQKHQRQTSK